MLRCPLTGALATACGDDGVRVFKEDETADPDQPVFSLSAHVPKAHTQDVNCIAWHPKEAGLLVSCSDNGEIAVWNYQSGVWEHGQLGLPDPVLNLPCTVEGANSTEIVMYDVYY